MSPQLPLPIGRRRGLRARVLGAFVAAALVGASCGGSASSDPAATATSTVDAPAPALAADTPGVTDDSIKLGVTIFDLSGIGRDNGDVEAKYRVAIDAINADGGVAGRTIEPVFATFDPLQAVTGDRACIELTEDEEVFAVIGANNGDFLLCFTELHETPFLTVRPLGASQIERSIAPAITVAARSDRLVAASIPAMAAEGVFDGVSVALHSSSDGEPQLDIARAALEEAGVEVVSETITGALGGDIVQTVGQMNIFAERWAADGAGVVVSVGDSGNLEVALGLANAGVDLTLAATQPAVDGSVYVDYGANPIGLEGAVATSPLGYADMFGQDVLGVRECVERFEAATGETVNLRPEGGEVANITTTVWACQLSEIFDLIATAAGPDLTRASFASALDELGEFSVTALGAGSGGKEDLSDAAPRIVRWDAASNAFGQES